MPIASQNLANQDPQLHAGSYKDYPDSAFVRLLRRQWGKDITYMSCLNDDGERWFRESIWTALDSYLDSGTTRKVRILEIGTCNGISAALLGQFGIVITLDIRSEQTEAGDRQRREIWGFLSGPVRGILVKDEADKHEAIAAFPFDFAFIDGDHTFDGVQRDWESVKRCGRVIFHDYRPQVPSHAAGTCAVVDGIDEDEWEKTFFPSFAVVTKKEE